MRLSTIDIWIIVYSAAMSLVALLVAPEQAAFRSSHLLHAVAIALALGVAFWIPRRGTWWPFVRHGYPVLLFGFFYRDTADYVFLIFDHWFDPALIRFEEALLGFNPAVWLTQFDAAWLLEFWMFGYGFYYVLAPVAVAVMLLTKQSELFRRMTLTSCAVFFVSYALFALFPLEGPRYALSEQLPPLSGWLFYPLVMWVQDSGSIHGGCMPSSHTAVAWVVTYYLYGAHRTVGKIMIAIAAMLTVGCVWGRFHYVTDVIVGLGLAVAGLWLTERRNRTDQESSALQPAPNVARVAR